VKLVLFENQQSVVLRAVLGKPWRWNQDIPCWWSQGG